MGAVSEIVLSRNTENNAVDFCVQFTQNGYNFSNQKNFSFVALNRLRKIFPVPQFGAVQFGLYFENTQIYCKKYKINKTIIIFTVRIFRSAPNFVRKINFCLWMENLLSSVSLHRENRFIAATEFIVNCIFVHRTNFAMTFSY